MWRWSRVLPRTDPLGNAIGTLAYLVGPPGRDSLIGGALEIFLGQAGQHYPELSEVARSHVETHFDQRLAADLIQHVPRVTEHVLRELLKALEIVLEEQLRLLLGDAGARFLERPAPADRQHAGRAPVHGTREPFMHLDAFDQVIRNHFRFSI
tara:strand:- start:203 stop:661 length:459 start_codon:yes stop_codon:yes gene_type:complete